VRELKTLGKIRHKEFWLRGNYRFILFDVMEKGSLHDVLHVLWPVPALDWFVGYDHLPKQKLSIQTFELIEIQTFLLNLYNNNILY
jgi:hypothetical protein